MKLKNFPAGIGALLLCSALLLPVPVRAADQSEGVTTITTRVPDTHIVLLDIGEHGSVLTGGKTYTSKDKQAEVARLAEQEYIIQPDKGWQIESVLYGKADALENVKLTDNTFTAPAVNSDDNQLTVTFKKGSAGNGTGGTTPDKDGGAGTGVKTGDTDNLFSVFALLVLSGSASLVLYMKTAQRRNKHE